jgi:hypothetical protein
MKHGRKRRFVTLALSTVVAAAGFTVAGLAGAPASMAAGQTTVTVGSSTRAVSGTDVPRLTNYLVVYTKGPRTGTNAFGFEAAVVSGKVTRVENGVGNMAVPAGGYVLSGHGTSRTWLAANAKVGVTVKVNDNTSGGTPLLPDIGVRTLRLFSIVRPTSGQFANRKLLKFPAVTANVGESPLEIRASRSTTSSVDWVGRQLLRNTDGTTTTLPPSQAQFYYAGDGHTHWHIRDFDEYDLLNSAGTVIEKGEKHGFCFEDNTDYRDWPGNPNHPGSPADPVYTYAQSCGQGNPQATSIVHGLSIGWSDTYPQTLPDQAIDITDVPNGDYTVKVTADWQHFWAEKNESNNAASAKIRISGTTVTLLSATDGL